MCLMLVDVDMLSMCFPLQLSVVVQQSHLQPENLLLDSFGVLKVSDFGLSAFSQQVRRITIPQILENGWCKKSYKPPQFEQGENVNLDDIDVVFNDTEV
ncbi:CBL-interacting protein kinase 9 [Camellia lanceoleosa]|uniref:CBL-interacting protein kinase 9 n=1 Tax=Camellia lanceoleosa TaxID=1840588 RepID=A0ACC0IFG5_9ERIC|nr:CBL-interacting protein kinase 9 [Camellia lanceoleosa]